MNLSRAKYDNIALWTSFLLWPVLVLLSSMANYRKNWAKNALWLFIVFYGFTFVPRGVDAQSYISWFQEFCNAKYDFNSFLGLLYSEGSIFVDVFTPFVLYIVSKFTNDYRLLFTVFAFLFGYFYSRNIWYLIEKTKGELSPYNKVFLLIFALIIPFWYIYAIRFWLAAQIFFFGVLRFTYDGNRKGILLAILSVLVHFSFVFPVSIFLIYLVVGNRVNVFFIFFILSFFISQIDLTFVRETLIAYTPVAFHSRVNGYVNEDTAANLNEVLTGAAWYAVWYKKLLNIAIAILILMVFTKGKEIWSKRTDMLRLLSFSLLFGGFANIFSVIPWVNRFLAVSNLFSISFLFFYFYLNNIERTSKRIFIYLIPFLFFYFVVAIRTGFDGTGIFAFISNPLIAPFLDSQISLIDLIK